MARRGHGELQRILFSLLFWRPVHLLWRIVRRMHRATVYLGEHTAVTQSIFGHLIYLDTRDQSLLPALVFAGYWEPHITKVFLRLLRPGQRVLEVGANVGYYTLLAGSRVGPAGRVVAFEANARMAELVQRSVTVNGFCGWTTVVPLAAAETSGTVTLHRLQYFQGSSNLFGFDDAFIDSMGDRSECVEVEATSLDDYFQGGEEVFDLIRMDAEGAEPLIFEGMRRILSKNEHLQVLIEFAPGMMRRAGRDPEQFLRSLVNMKFDIQVIEHSGRLKRRSVDEILPLAFCDLLLSR